jgi:predicted small lipoprotein YifL
MTATPMRKIIAILVLATSLAACGMISTLVDGFKHASAVASELEQATGMKPEVGFNWHNGRLTRVSVGFPKIYDAKPLRELADLVRSSVRKQFEQTPENIELAFSIGATAPDTSAQAEKPRQHASLAP